MALTFSVPDTELTATLHNRMASVVDNIFKGTPFLKAMSTYGGVETQDGGYELVIPIRMAKNTAVGSFSGYDILDTTPQDVLTSARYPWAADYATISISWTEEKKNQGRGRLLNLLEQKITDAQDTIKDKLNSQLLATQPAAGSKDPATITEIIDNTPTADTNRTTSQGSIGNANTWWRNKYTTGGAFTVADMNTMWNDVSDGADFPTFLLTSQTIFEYYEAALIGQIRYESMDVANAAFKSLAFKTAPILWDPAIGNTAEIYYINTKYLKLAFMAGADFISGEFIEPENQAAKTAKILWMGQLYSSNRRRLGTLHTITAPA